MTIPDIVLFIYYVLPGFIAIEIYGSIYPAKRRSDFFSVAWSLIFGISITFVVLYFYQPLDFAISGKTTLAQPSLILLLLLVAAGVVVGLVWVGIRWTRFWIANRMARLRWLAPSPQSVWAKINQVGNQDWAVVFMKDSAIYRGYIKSYTYDPDAADQDFLLSDAYLVRRDLTNIYQITGQGVYLKLNNVSRIEFVQRENRENYCFS